MIPSKPIPTTTLNPRMTPERSSPMECLLRKKRINTVDIINGDRRIAVVRLKVYPENAVTAAMLAE